MRLTILIIIVTIGVMIPLLWIMGTLTSIVYFIRHREKTPREEGVFAFDAQLGPTMADGGHSLGEEKKEPTEIRQFRTAETPQSSPEQITRKSDSGKMFWWGGY